MFLYFEDILKVKAWKIVGALLPGDNYDVERVECMLEAKFDFTLVIETLMVLENLHIPIHNRIDQVRRSLDSMSG